MFKETIKKLPVHRTPGSLDSPVYRTPGGVSTLRYLELFWIIIGSSFSTPRYIGHPGVSTPRYIGPGESRLPGT
jgi:hypothetical protein